MEKEILPGTKVSAFCPFSFRIPNTSNNDFMPGTVVCRHGYRSSYNPDWIYPDVVDIRFDHIPHLVSHGHFTDGVKVIEYKE